MYNIRVEVSPHECVVKVYVENNVIVFEADTIEEVKKDANKFVIDLLKETWRVSY